MNYDEYDAGAPAVDWQESHDEAQAQAQMARDQDDAYAILNSMTDFAPFLPF